MSEDEMIRTNMPYLYKCVWIFLKQNNISPVLYLQDGVQEAAIAYLKRMRYVAAHPGTDPMMSSVIARRLRDAFQDLYGVHMRRKTPGEAPLQVMQDEVMQSSAHSWNDSITQLDTERWLRTLPADDRRIADLMLKGEKPGNISDILKLHRNTVYNRKKAIQKSFMNYFKEAG